MMNRQRERAHQRPGKGSPGFTLVELLTVAAVVVLLFSILLPALDRSIYEAELAKCSWNLGEIARSVSLYAREYQRFYPHRQVIATSGEPMYSLQDAQFDDRPVLRNHIALNRLLNDPLGQEVDLERPRPGSPIDAGLNLWFGVTFHGPQAGPGMVRLNDRLMWTDTSSGQAIPHGLRWLASDLDVLSIPATTAMHSHPDKSGILSAQTSQDWDAGAATASGTAPSRGPTWSRWMSTATQRGEVDFNAVMEDGAAERWRNVAWDDPRMVKVPHRTDATDWPAWRVQVPPR
jgi:type II secretory pathway pseudopilin PulG